MCWLSRYPFLLCWQTNMEWEVQRDGKSDETMDVQNMTSNRPDSAVVQVSRESAIMAGGSLYVDMSGIASEFSGNSHNPLSQVPMNSHHSYKSNSVDQTHSYESLPEYPRNCFALVFVSLISCNYYYNWKYNKTKNSLLQQL